MDYNALAEDFWEQGFLVVDELFDSALMDLCQQRINAHFDHSPDFCHTQEFLSKSATEVVPWFPQQEGESCFDTVEQDQHLRHLTQTILGERWHGLYCMTMYSPPDTLGQAWHQDCDPENQAVFNMNRLVYSEAIRPEIGGELVVVPGSHRRGLITAGPVDEDFDDQQLIMPRKGTLVMLHGHSWHRVMPVRDGSRSSTNFRCSPQGTPDDITDICVYRNMRYRFETDQVVEERS